MHAWEAWNEPNVATSWHVGAVNPAEYADLLMQASIAIRASSDAKVVAAGLAPLGDGIMAPSDFVEGLYRAGARDSFDVLAFHPYTHPKVPTVALTAPTNPWQEMETVHQKMVSEWGDSEKPIWLTEFGAPSAGDLDACMMVEAQQENILDVGIQLASARNYIERVYLHTLRDGAPFDVPKPSDADPEQYFGLLHEDWSEKPAAATVRSAISSFRCPSVP